MTIDFIHAFQSEWLKKKRSLASYLVIVGAFFTPLVIIVARLLHHDTLQPLYAANDFWLLQWRNAWESMAIFFLPMGSILATSLMTQIEYKNNAWKHVHTLPLTATTIFLAKLAVILVMIVQFIVLFDVGIYLSAVVPYLLVDGTPYPNALFPLRFFVVQNAAYFVACLPIVAAQYLLSLQFRNFLVPIGVGFLAWVGALAALSWKFGYLLPYSYSMLNYLKDIPARRATFPDFDLIWLAIAYFILFVLLGYVLDVIKAQKG